MSYFTDYMIDFYQLVCSCYMSAANYTIDFYFHFKLSQMKPFIRLFIQFVTYYKKQIQKLLQLTVKQRNSVEIKTERMVQPMTDYSLGTVLGAYENEELTEKKHLV